MVALARRSPSEMLYSLVPRSSQWPSMSTSMLALPFSQAALASSVLASAGRISYLSKSKWMSFRSVVARKVPGCGRAVAVAARLMPPPLVLLLLAAAGPATEAGLIALPVLPTAPLGAGTDAIDVAGRFAQPKATRARSIAGTAIHRVLIALLQFVNRPLPVDAPGRAPASTGGGLSPTPGLRSSAPPSNTARVFAAPLPRLGEAPPRPPAGR